VADRVIKLDDGRIDERFEASQPASVFHPGEAARKPDLIMHNET